jgi:hypothetical protein
MVEANAASVTAPVAVSPTPKIIAACGPPTWLRSAGSSGRRRTTRSGVTSTNSIPAAPTHGTVWRIVAPTQLSSVVTPRGYWSVTTCPGGGT